MSSLKKCKFDQFNWSKILTFSLSAMVGKIFYAMPTSEKFLTTPLELLDLN